MLKQLKTLLWLYLDDLLLIAGGTCLTVAAAHVWRPLGWAAAGAFLIWYGLLVARAGAGRWRK
ncbi:hypothetical protein [Candidatus Agathobaculum pullicola]|uniref:hypothetical protein n=1 Tax=Candidatus Agathobaculum pullicola TaxID=2838426 RepID=UPI003F91C499